MKIARKNINGIITTVSVVIMLFLIMATSCGRKKTEVIGAVGDRKQIARLHANEITTIISDSGITRYRISAPVWDIFDKAEPSYWEFPEGIHLERFDLDLNVDANIHSNYAKYFDKQELWELRGEVDATNLEGERFETERLYWDQKKERIHSDTIVKVTDVSGAIMYGDDFVSNQSLSKYSFKNGRGSIAVKEDEEEK
ncbi:LPS export ABC transporter periplasmic protein LptC [Paludibacter sp. 221]|uniref:LPS export ABC transporter periplasmic protein LptC n=1 Tax=Paludibacter sp. 221 TaxID=2302939 RepID=UPI0013CF6ADE|nr:LPS export ABC transporter periplasmic protein LptC [Paludibacter sp. 221]NDV47655.1 LPS export ABC transporter periplasmic protein LptC [Paludibacter sp. 221]